jgi:riboflavin kinase
MNLKIILYELSRGMNSVRGRVHISSERFAESLGVSQQSASRYLKLLENENLIKRKVGAKSRELELTDNGIKLLNEVYLDLSDLFEDKKNVNGISIEGIVAKGLGEGAYYVNAYQDKINEKLNFIPFEGTLNVKLNKNFIDFNFSRNVSFAIDSFNKNGRTFGEVKCVPVKVSTEGKGGVIEVSRNCFIIIPERTHHKGVVEVISEFNLREKLSLIEGSRVKLEVY